MGLAAKLSDVSMRAGHHLREAAPLIPVIVEAFEREGFEFKPKRTRLWFRAPTGTVYIVARGKQFRTQAVVARWGQPATPIAEFDLSALDDKVRQGRYTRVKATIQRIARKVRLSAGF